MMYLGPTITPKLVHDQEREEAKLLKHPQVTAAAVAVCRPTAPSVIVQKVPKSPNEDLTANSSLAIASVSKPSSVRIPASTCDLASTSTHTIPDTTGVAPTIVHNFSSIPHGTCNIPSVPLTCRPCSSVCGTVSVIASLVSGHAQVSTPLIIHDSTQADSPSDCDAVSSFLSTPKPVHTPSVSNLASAPCSIQDLLSIPSSVPFSVLGCSSSVSDSPSVHDSLSASPHNMFRILASIQHSADTIASVPSPDIPPSIRISVTPSVSALEAHLSVASLETSQKTSKSSSDNLAAHLLGFGCAESGAIPTSIPVPTSVTPCQPMHHPEQEKARLSRDGQAPGLTVEVCASMVPLEIGPNAPSDHPALCTGRLSKSKYQVVPFSICIALWLLVLLAGHTFLNDFIHTTSPSTHTVLSTGHEAVGSFPGVPEQAGIPISISDISSILLRACTIHNTTPVVPLSISDTSSISLSVSDSPSINDLISIITSIPNSISVPSSIPSSVSIPLSFPFSIPISIPEFPSMTSCIPEAVSTSPDHPVLLSIRDLLSVSYSVSSSVSDSTSVQLSIPSSVSVSIPKLASISFRVPEHPQLVPYAPNVIRGRP